MAMKLLYIILAPSIAILLFAFSTQPLSAQELKPRLTLIDGQEVDMEIVSLEGGAISDGETKIDLSELMSIQFNAEMVDSRPSRSVFLSGGGQLAIKSVQFDGEKFRFTGPTGTYSLPPESVRGIILDSSADDSRFQRAINGRSVENDVVIAKTSNGLGVVKGLIESIGEDGKLTLNYKGKSKRISNDKLVAIVTADLKPSAPESPLGSVKLTDGSIVSGGIGDLKDKRLEMRLSGNASIFLRWNEIASISMNSDRVIYLSDLTPADVEQNALATVNFDWKRDLSVDGNPIRLRNVTDGTLSSFAKGVGTHSACRLTFDNESDFDRLVATVGIDIETEGKGDCEVSVWGDGIKLWESVVTGSTDPVPLNVDITGMKSITLVVRNGKFMDLADHVDWANIRFLRSGN